MLIKLGDSGFRNTGSCFVFTYRQKKMAGSSTWIEEILLGQNLQIAVEKFKAERIDVDNFLSLSEQQLIRLGVTTIGDRLRLTERVKSEINKLNRVKITLERQQVIF